MAKNIRAGAAVRSNTTGKLGRTFRQHAGKIRGSIWVQWDGERDRQTIRVQDVTLVADDYDAAKIWEPGAPRLIYAATGERVLVGDKVTISGAVSVVCYFRPPHKPCSEGYVSVHAPGEPNASAKYYVGVIGAKWVDREDRTPTPDVVAMIDGPPPVPSDVTTSDATTSHEHLVTYGRNATDSAA